MAAPSPQLNLVVLRSTDIERAASFYTKLGLHLTRHAHGTGPEHYAAETHDMVFEIYPLTAKSSPTTGTRIGFRVDDVDGLVKTLAEAGGTIITPPADSEWGRRAVMKDLDGHAIELVAPKSH